MKKSFGEFNRQTKMSDHLSAMSSRNSGMTGSFRMIAALASFPA